MTSTTWHGRTYTCEDRGDFGIFVSAPCGAKLICTRSKASDEAEARRWLSSRSLRKGKARALVADEMAKSDNQIKPNAHLGPKCLANA